MRKFICEIFEINAQMRTTYQHTNHKINTAKCLRAKSRNFSAIQYNKPEIPGQTVCYKQEFVISGQFHMRYCSTWLRSLLCYIKKFVIEEIVIRVFHCINYV